MHVGQAFADVELGCVFGLLQLQNFQAGEQERTNSVKFIGDTWAIEEIAHVFGHVGSWANVVDTQFGVELG